MVPLNVARFAFPDFKTIEILYCDKPTGSWATGVRWVFFNGEAIWLEGKADEWFEPETRAEVRRCHAILREHRDAFTTLAPEPLVPTERAGVYANRFPAAGKTVVTLYNARHRTVRGPVLRLPHREGATYYDAWHHRPAEVVRDGDDRRDPHGDRPAGGGMRGGGAVWGHGVGFNRSPPAPPLLGLAGSGGCTSRAPASVAASVRSTVARRSAER